VIHFPVVVCTSSPNTSQAHRRVTVKGLSWLRAPMNDMAHRGCALDDPDAALAFGKVRGYRLVLASLHEDDDASVTVLDEIGDCAECLRCQIRFLARLAGSLGANVAECYGQDQAAAGASVREATY
jgi:hypothetical protein